MSDDSEVMEFLRDKPVDMGQPTDGDTLPPESGEVTVDEDHLVGYLTETLKNDISDKESAGFNEKRDYDYKAYYGVKDPEMSYHPWPRSFNTPECLTPVLLDTALSALYATIFIDPSKSVTVKGVGEEDVKNAVKLQALLNWQIGTDIENFPIEMFYNLMQSLLCGTSYLKIIREYDESGNYKLRPITIPLENVFTSINSSGCTKNDTDHFTQMVPLTIVDLLKRKATGRYKNLDTIQKGFKIAGENLQQNVMLVKQNFSGIDLSKKIERDNYFIAESYVPYYVPKGSAEPLDLLVWWSPSSKKILRVIKNDEQIPFSDWYVYPIRGMAFHQSFPDKIRNEQEEANYIKKQVSDATDILISPSAYYEQGTDFDPDLDRRVPGGRYPMQNAKSMIWEPQNTAPVIERQRALQDIWQKAERKTGFSDIMQGIYSPSSSRTLGGDVMRAQRADNRFNGSILPLIKAGWKKTLNLLYFYDDKYMPRNTKVRVQGTNTFKTIEQIFPKKEGVEGSDSGMGISGKFDFDLGNLSAGEADQQKQNDIVAADSVLTHPIFSQSPRSAWKAMKKKWEALGQKDFEDVVPEPKEARILSPRDVINALMSGETGIKPSPESDPVEYQNEVMEFMTSENFKEAPESVKAEFQKFIILTESIRQAQTQAFADFRQIAASPVLPGMGLPGQAEQVPLSPGVQNVQ